MKYPLTIEFEQRDLKVLYAMAGAMKTAPAMLIIELIREAGIASGATIPDRQIPVGDKQYCG